LVELSGVVSPGYVALSVAVRASVSMLTCMTVAAVVG
jgi:hypothetical protein